MVIPIAIILNPEKIFVNGDILEPLPNKMVKYEKHETMGFYENPR